MVFSHSEAFQAPILFERGASGPNLGPPDFSKEKYKGPMAPVVKKNGKITMKMHCQDFQKMLCLVFFVKCLSWPPWANLGIDSYLQDTNLGDVKNARKTNVFFTF